MGKIIFAIIFLSSVNAFAQDTSYWERRYPNQHWQKQKDWNAPGNYEIAATLSKSTIYKGEEFDLNIYVTGYGIIGNSKIYFLFSDTFYSKESYIVSTITVNEKGEHVFGGAPINLTDGSTFILRLNGLGDSTWPYHTFYADMPANDYSILSEMNITNPPARMHIKLNPDIDAGDYSIKLFFTYYNGEEWKSSVQVLTFHVNSWIEENPGLVWIIGILISLVSLITVVPVIYGYGIRFKNYFFKESPKVIQKPKSKNK